MSPDENATREKGRHGLVAGAGLRGILLKGLGKRPLLRAVNHVVLAVASAAAVFPFLWMVLSSFKTKAEVMEPGLALPAVWQWGNYREILLESPIPRYLFNSLFVASLTMALQVVCCALFSYAVVFMRFKGRRLLFSLVLFTYMVPTAATYGMSMTKDSAYYLSLMMPAVVMGNALAIVVAGLLNGVGLKFPKTTGNGKLMKKEDIIAADRKSVV